MYFFFNFVLFFLFYISFSFFRSELFTVLLARWWMSLSIWGWLSPLPLQMHRYIFVVTWLIQVTYSIRFRQSPCVVYNEQYIFQLSFFLRATVVTIVIVKFITLLSPGLYLQGLIFRNAWIKKLLYSYACGKKNKLNGIHGPEPEGQTLRQEQYGHKVNIY